MAMVADRTALSSNYKRERGGYNKFLSQLYDGNVPDLRKAGRAKRAPPKPPPEVVLTDPEANNVRNVVTVDALKRDLPPVKDRQIRLLLLHGTSSNSQVTKFQCGSLEQACGTKVKPFYVTGKFPAYEDGPGAEVIWQMKGMFPQYEPFFEYAYNPTLDGVKNSNCTAKSFDKLDEGIEHIRQKVREEAEGSIDAIFGFAAGSNIANILVAGGLCGKYPEFAEVRAVVHIGSGIPGWQQQLPAEFYKQKLRIPNLIVGGGPTDYEYDGSKRKSFKISELYEGSTVLCHEDGHQPMPRDSTKRSIYCNKVINFILKACK